MNTQNVKTVNIGSVSFGSGQPLGFILGPCAMESRDHALKMAESLRNLGEKLGAKIVFKASFDKANRTSLTSPRGVGLEPAIPIFAEIKEQFGLPTLTDIHETHHVSALEEVIDVFQIPAFLCRQTDLLVAAAKSNKVVNIKKGQFLAPWDMIHQVNKVRQSGNDNVLITERGTTFGYNTLVVDYRGIPRMVEQCQAPVIMDATHAVQQPGGQGGASGGERVFVPLMAKAAIVAGAHGVFMETHDNPDRAVSDGPNMVPLDMLESVLEELMALHAHVNGA